MSEGRQGVADHQYLGQVVSPQEESQVEIDLPEVTEL